MALLSSPQQPSVHPSSCLAPRRSLQQGGVAVPHEGSSENLGRRRQQGSRGHSASRFSGGVGQNRAPVPTDSKSTHSRTSHAHFCFEIATTQGARLGPQKAAGVAKDLRSNTALVRNSQLRFHRLVGLPAYPRIDTPTPGTRKHDGGGPKMLNPHVDVFPHSDASYPPQCKGGPPCQRKVMRFIVGWCRTADESWADTMR